MKTAIILLILAFPVYYSLRKLVRVFTRKESGCSCSSCPSGIKSGCSSRKVTPQGSRTASSNKISSYIKK